MADIVYALLAAFPKGHRDHDSVRIPCPVHGGTGPNVHVWPDPATQGRWQVYCHSRQCDSLALVKAIEQAAGVSLGRHAPRRGNIDDYIAGVYETADGRRTTSYRKDWPADWQGQPCDWGKGKGKCTKATPHKHMWQDAGAPTRDLLLLEWRPAEPAEPDVAAIVEGEKTARAVRAAGWAAYSYMGGSGKAGFADYSPVKGKRVVVLPDADSAGRKAAAESVRKAAQAGAASIHLVHVDPELETGDDAADMTAAEIDATIRTALGGVDDGDDDDDGEADEGKPTRGKPTSCSRQCNLALSLLGCGTTRTGCWRRWRSVGWTCAPMRGPAQRKSVASTPGRRKPPSSTSTSACPPSFGRTGGPCWPTAKRTGSGICSSSDSVTRNTSDSGSAKTRGIAQCRARSPTGTTTPSCTGWNCCPSGTRKSGYPRCSATLWALKTPG